MSPDRREPGSSPAQPLRKHSGTPNGKDATGHKIRSCDLPEAYGKNVGDMNMLQVLVNLDDLIIFGKTLAGHEERLVKVLDRLQEAELKISLDKCQFCRTKVKYVGPIVTADSVAVNPTKVEAVTNWSKPSNLKTLQSFLGFCRYYQ